MKYIPLRVKTSYSLLTSLNDIHKMVLFCKENKIDTLCICDTNMYGVMEFYKECINNGIKPVIGLELNVESNIILLYAKNYEGYKNLCRLVYIMQDNNLTLDILKEYNCDLICVSKMDLSDIYEDFYFGYTNINERKNKKSVYINNILCLKESDKEYLKYLYLIKNGKKISDNINYEIADKCYMDFCDYDYDNAYELVNKCNIKFEQDKSLFPKYDVNNSKDYLLLLCKKGLYKRLDGKVTKRYYDRLLYELEVIDKMGFNDYFLVVWDYVKYAKKRGILVGSGRGSASGSLVSYSLGITEVDPIKYNLLFERFLNVERISMPDIDIDFESLRRDEVVRYVMSKYGKDRVLPIITFSTLSSKQVLRDVGRIFDIDISIMDSLSKLIDNNVSLTDALKDKKVVNYVNDNKLKEIYKIALKLEGLKRQISVHAAGVIIGGKPLNSYIPLQKYEDYYLSGYSMEHLEGLGLIKMDFLSLKNLDMVLNIIDNIKNINYNDIPIDDKDALKLIHDGNTSGIFQFESSGMKKFLSRLKATNFEDVISAIALYRPGPSNNIDSFIRRKNGIEKIDYIDDSIKDILKPTYGIIVYQEQILQIANVMAGYSYAEADILRRAMSKKKREILLDEKDKFINRSIKRGYKKEVATKTYDYILKFADYGFNKAHSVGYSMLSMKMSYLKTHYKEDFMASLLTNSIGSEIKTKEYIDECKKMNVNVLKPDINLSEYKYKKCDGSIVFSLASIRNVGSVICKEIVKERENGLYKDFFDFMKRCYGKINRKTVESLIDASAFDCFNYNHKTLYDNIDSSINYATISKDLDESLIEKPEMIIKDEFPIDILIAKEKDAFGFYLTNHPATKYKLEYKAINLSDVSNYFDKNVNLVGIVDKINTTKTKNDESMAFINISDEYSNIDIVVFPNRFDLIENINKKDVVLISGKVEKRLSKYQVVLDNLKKCDIIKNRGEL